MAKITVKNTIVELDGDEMTRVMWQMVKEKLLEPYMDMKTEYYDLHVQKRDETNDQVTVDSAHAIAKHGVGVKCATITPDADRVKEYNLKKQWPSPNGQIRAILDGTVFRKPIIPHNIPAAVRSWREPITIARHAYGDIYKSAEMRISKPGKAKLIFEPDDGSDSEELMIHKFDGPGIIMGIHNVEKSIRSFARSCLTYALDEKIDLWFGTKDTISKQYHARFKEIFYEEVNRKQLELDASGIRFRYMLIDDAVAQIMKHKGGLLWACMNYEGDIFSDMIASGFGSLGLMTSVLVSPDGKYEYEAAHGTVKRHYYEYLKGNVTSTNPTAIIFTWTGGIRKRGELDGTPEVVDFANRIEKALLETIEAGQMTKDLIGLCQPSVDKFFTTEEFIDAIARRLANG